MNPWGWNGVSVGPAGSKVGEAAMNGLELPHSPPQAVRSRQADRAHCRKRKLVFRIEYQNLLGGQA